MTGHLIVLVGNIGTGKSTYRKTKFNSGEVIICPDEWGLNDGDEIERRIVNTLDKALENGETVVVDGNNVTKARRDFFLFFAREHKAKATIIDFGKGDVKSLERRIQSSPENSRSQWEQIHLSNQEKYQQPDESEKFDEIIRPNES